MRLGQALGYFLREAAVSLRRGWKVSLLAVLTIATSLFVGGLFLLLGHNLRAASRAWRSEARLVAYLEPGLAAEERSRLVRWLEAQEAVAGVRVVSALEARDRLRRGFPGLAEILEAPEAPPLPASLEVALAPATPASVAGALAAALRRRAGVDLVDDDRDWLDRLDAIVAVVRLAGLALGALLLAAAVFTIYSVIRLMAHLYREEIAVMRLVGATEFLIRGPFYVEGLLQGLLGGALALSGLLVLATAGGSGEGLLRQLLLGRFLPVEAVLWLLALGGLSGLLGAVLSLRREVFDIAPTEPTGGAPELAE